MGMGGWKVLEGRPMRAWKGNARWRWPAIDRARCLGVVAGSGGLDRCFGANWFALQVAALEHHC